MMSNIVYRRNLDSCELLDITDKGDEIFPIDDLDDEIFPMDDLDEPKHLTEIESTSLSETKMSCNSSHDTSFQDHVTELEMIGFNLSHNRDDTYKDFCNSFKEFDHISLLVEYGNGELNLVSVDIITSNMCECSSVVNAGLAHVWDYKKNRCFISFYKSRT